MATANQPKTTAYTSGQAPQRQTAPTARPKKMSDYGRQLSEKQKAKFEYGLRERQFRGYFERAARSPIATGQALFTHLELRLDNCVFRTGIAKTRKQARQLVGHGLVLVNGKRVNLPSYAVKSGDQITLKKDDFLEYNKEVILPDWLSYNAKTKTATVERLPKADDIQTDLNTQLIVEFYSR